MDALAGAGNSVGPTFKWRPKECFDIKGDDDDVNLMTLFLDPLAGAGNSVGSTFMWRPEEYFDVKGDEGDVDLMASYWMCRRCWQRRRLNRQVAAKECFDAKGDDGDVHLVISYLEAFAGAGNSGGPTFK